MFKTSTRAARHRRVEPNSQTGFYSRCRRSRIFLFAIAIICHFFLFDQPISHLVGKKFHIVVLTKNRPNSLLRLLKSIQASNYGNDVVLVNIRIDGTDSKTHYAAESFEWPLKTVTGTQSGGLRAAWLGALTNPTENAIILEDDVELSPAWYSWLTKAWRAYGDRDDLAGISLQRQNFIPQKPFKKTSSETEIVNDHQPFLYKLVGSIGFSPHPKRWREFLEWVATKDLGTFDAHVEGLVTSDWYKNDKESIWTQLFIRFCEERGLYTLYINLPEGKTLAAHWREKGEHFVEGRGRDFGLATTVKHEFPKTLVKYEWDGVVSGRRTRAHFCGKRHSPLVVDMLRNEFGFREVDANKGEEFDIIYGGYPHCGSKPFDWDMKTGLNARLDFSKLRPSQVWFPCMGCRASVCNKRELCRIQHGLDPTACFLWPEHRDDLEHAMRTAPKGTMWVQKRDGPTLHLHAGASVRYIESVEGLTAKHDGTYIVQPYVEPFLGRSRRKSEFRTYIAVTSTNPFRAYIHSKPWVMLAGRQYDSSDLSDLCIHDTHAHSKKPCDQSLSVDDRQLSFTDYAAKEGLNATDQATLLRRVNDLLASIIQSGWPPAHPVNEGIRQSGASCFSYLRADIGFGPELQPFLYEINEFPYVNEEATAIRPIVRESHRDLFRMIGLDRPPLPVAEREAWEAAHMGGWRRLRTTPTLLRDGNQAPSPATATVAPIFGIRRAGTDYGGWTYNATGLTPNSVVYSVGLGEDTSWDEAMIQDHRLHVWGFDPTPKSIQYVKHNPALGGNFHFTAEGLATQPGTLAFTKPANPDHVSMRIGQHDGLGETIHVPVNTLEGWMETNGHSHIDILKIDVEGSEYDLLEDWIRRKWFPMDQLLVEYHHRFLKDKSRHMSVLNGLKENGFEVIHDRKGQEISFQRSNRRFNNNKVLQHAARIQAQHGIVLLQFLNEGFVEMTKSWICNVRRFDVVLPKILFITSDQAAYNALTAFDVTLNVVLEPYSAPKSMTYGQTDYYRYMLFRTKLISTLLDSNHALWLVESDAVWLEDPTDLVLGTPGDLVTMSDKPPQKLLQGGFLLLRPTGVTKRLWTRMRDDFESKMKAVTKKDIGNDGSEQLMLDKMIRDDSGLRVEWLDPHKFVPGKWYDNASFRKTVPAPFVVLNNWIKGTDDKIKRAKKWKHWFLDEQGSCFDPRT